MYEEVVKKILESVNENSSFADLYPKFSGEGYTAHKIDAENFHEIKKADINRKIAFVDGGNAEIIGSANFSLSMVRVCCAVYQGRKKLGLKKYETLALTQAFIKENEIWYKTLFFKAKNQIDLHEVLFSSFDQSLMTGFNRADIGSVSNAIRRFSELEIAKIIAKEKIADVIVLDGNLQCTLTDEDRYLSELYEECGKNKILIAALSKTNSLFTGDGNLLSAVLLSLSPFDSWFYHPIAEISSKSHKAEMFFAKFHNKSKHVFRFEVYGRQREYAEELINELAGNCTDPVFIGYPYGLVEADKIARISHNEKESLKARFLFMLQDKNIEKYLNSKNAHGILDMISF